MIHALKFRVTHSQTFSFETTRGNRESVTVLQAWLSSVREGRELRLRVGGMGRSVIQRQ